MAENNQRFDVFAEWVNYAPRWLTRHPQYKEPTFRAYCFDAQGRQCLIGADFMRARDENTFPIFWYWPDQIPAMAQLLRHIAESDMKDVGASGAPHLLELFIDKARAIVPWDTRNRRSHASATNTRTERRRSGRRLSSLKRRGNARASLNIAGNARRII